MYDSWNGFNWDSEFSSSSLWSATSWILDEKNVDNTLMI